MPRSPGQTVWGQAVGAGPQDPPPPKLAGLVMQPAGAVAWWRREKRWLGDDVGQILQLRGSGPHLSLTWCCPTVWGRTPTSSSTGACWHVPALLSAAGLRVSPAPQLCPSPTSLLLPNPLLCHPWPFCELDQTSPAPTAQPDGLWAASPCQYQHGMSPPSPSSPPLSSLAVTNLVQERKLPWEECMEVGVCYLSCTPSFACKPI